MRLTKFGFHLNLLGFSNFLSVLGILVSIIGEIGGYVLIWLLSSRRRYITPIVYGVTGVLLVFMIPYLIMWILLKKKNSKQDIPGIEKIGKIYTYVSGSLEIIWAIVWIVFSILDVLNTWPRGAVRGENLIYIIGSAIFLIFACLKIHGVRVDNNKLLGIFLGFRYAQFFLYMIVFSVLSVSIAGAGAAIVSLIVVKAYFFLDIGLTVILHSIRVDRKNTAGTESSEEKKELFEKEIEKEDKTLHCIAASRVIFE